MAERQIEFEPHSAKQDSAIFSDHSLTCLSTGTQWGKSQAGSLWLKRKIHEIPEKGCNFLLAAPTYKILHQSSLPYFLSYMEGMGTYKRAQEAFEMGNGRSVYFRTQTDPDSIVGIPNIRAFWLDEAGKLSLYFWENVQARAAAQGAVGLLSSSPYAKNWFYKDIVKPSELGKREDVNLIRAASWENPYHTLSKPGAIDSMRDKMDKRRFDALFGGEYGTMVGAVYDCFTDDNMMEPFGLPQGTRYVAGIDWGYTDPFVMLVVAILPSGLRFIVSEYYKPGLIITDQIDVAKRKAAVFKIETFYCGPDQPGSIDAFNQAGLSAQPADNDIRKGVDIVYGYIKERKLKFFEGETKYTVDELEGYHYPEPEELDQDDSSKEQNPVGQNDHAMDALRYAMISTYKFEDLPVDAVTKRKPRMTKHTEHFR